MKCPKCEKRESVLEYSREPYNTLRTGFGKIPRCRQCYIEDIEEYIKGCEKNLEEQKELLKKEQDAS